MQILPLEAIYSIALGRKFLSQTFQKDKITGFFSFQTKGDFGKIYFLFFGKRL